MGIESGRSEQFERGEVDRVEQEQFRTTVEQLFSERGTPLSGTSRVFVIYKKGETEVFLIRPNPQMRSTMPEDDVFGASVSELLYQTDSGQRVCRDTHIELSSFPNDERDFFYHEEQVVFDQEGNKIYPPSPSDTFEVLQRIKTEYVLGAAVMTRERYDRIMGILNSLRPEDRVP
jgi:hypothetical protein